MAEDEWVDVGDAGAFPEGAVVEVVVGGATLAVTRARGALGAVSGVCNHAGGPLSRGGLDGDYLVCPWHHYKFHRQTGAGEPGYADDRVPSHAIREDGGRVWVRAQPSTPRHRAPHPPHRLARPVVRAEGPPRVLGLSTTAMDPAYPRYSTSDALLDTALAHAASLGAEVQTIRLNGLRFRACEGYYSKSARACTWPCSITQMDPTDELEPVYEALVHWCDALILATPIRWGAASSLFYKLAERLNCVQNQLTTRGRVLIQNKVASFIVTGGQDGVQAVAGHLLGYFGELGFLFPQFPYVAHTRGWEAEDMENNVAFVQGSEKLREGTRELAGRTVAEARRLLEGASTPDSIARGGRKAGA